MIKYVNSRKAASKYKILRGKFANIFFFTLQICCLVMFATSSYKIQVGKIRGFIQFFEVFFLGELHSVLPEIFR